MATYERALAVSSLLSVLLLGACTTATSVYSPAVTPAYSGKAPGVSIQVVSVTDGRRSHEGPEFYRGSAWDSGKYDRDVAVIVREALQTELRRFGMAVQGPTRAGTTPDRRMDCTIVAFKAVLTDDGAFLRSYGMDLTLALRFKLVDPGTGAIVTENTRSEIHHIPLGSNKPSVPFDNAVIDNCGDVLLNTLLPKVIAQEIESNRHFRDLAGARDTRSP